MQDLIEKKRLSAITLDLYQQILDELPCLSWDLCGLIVQYLIWPTKKNKHFICEWDLYWKITQGFHCTLHNHDFNDMTEQQTKAKRLYFHSYCCAWQHCATDCSESDELSINEENPDQYRVRRRYRFHYEYDDRDDKSTEITEMKTKSDLFALIQPPTDYYDAHLNEYRHLYYHLFGYPHLTDHERDDVDSGDEADNESET